MGWSPERFNSFFTAGRNMVIVVAAICSVSFAAWAHKDVHDDINQLMQWVVASVVANTQAAVSTNALVEFDLDVNLAKLERDEELCDAGKIDANDDTCLMVKTRIKLAKERREFRKQKMDEAAQSIQTWLPPGMELPQ